MAIKANKGGRAGIPSTTWHKEVPGEPVYLRLYGLQDTRSAPLAGYVWAGQQRPSVHCPLHTHPGTPETRDEPLAPCPVHPSRPWCSVLACTPRRRGPRTELALPQKRTFEVHFRKTAKKHLKMFRALPAAKLPQGRNGRPEGEGH